MPTIVLTAQGKVTGLWGSAIVKGADGQAHPLKLGDIVRRGDVILTSQDGIVQLTSGASAAPVSATPTPEAAAAAVPAQTAQKVPAAGSEVDQVIEKLAQDDADAATAAGLAGGDGGEFLPGLRVDRITESLTTLGLNNNQESDANDTPPVGAAAASAAALANIAPSALDGTVSGPENATLPVALRGVDSDGNVVSVTVTSVPPGGTLLLADGITVVSAGQTLTPAQAVGLLFKPAVDFVGQAAITFFVTDNQGSTSNGATVSLNLVDTSPPPPINQPPVGVNDSATTAEDTPATGNVLGNDSDPDGNALTVTQFSLNGVTYAAGATAVVAGIGSLTLAANGAYTFTPEPNYNGPVPVATYTVSDGVDSVTATLTLSVTAVADAPVAAPDTVPATEDQPVVFDPRGNDGSIDGTPLAITAIGGQPIAIGTPVVLPQGTVSLNADGTLTFTPNPNVNGPVVFDYTVSSGGAASTSQVTINIAPVNDDPVAQNDLASTPVNAPATIAVLANDSDVDGDALTVTSASVDPALGTVTVNPNGTLTFNPANNVSGPVVIQYSISDGQGGSANASVTVNIGPNTPPQGTDATVTVAEDGTRGFSASDFGFSDADAGQSFANLRVDTLPAAGTLTLSGVAVAAGQVIAVADLGNLVFTPAPNANGTGYASFGFSVQDSAGAFDTAPNQISIDVSAVNDAPLAVATHASGDEDATDIPVMLGGSDIDGSIASFTITSLPANGVLLFGGVAVTLGQSIPATAGAATLSFVPAANFNGTTAFDFTATDNEGAVSPSVSAPITVAPVNDAPVAVDDLASTPINTSTTITVLSNDSDVDGNVLTVTAASVDPARGTVSINPNGTLAFTPAGNVSGPVVVSYTISDGQGGFASATVTVNVGLNTPPTGANALFVIAEDGSRTFTATDFGFSDADAGQSFANVRIDVLPAAGTLTLSGVAVVAGQVIAVADLGNLVYAPAPNANGSSYASFNFSVQDSGGAFDTLPNQITIDVTPVADAAVIGGVASGATVEDTTLSTGGTLTVTDPDASEAAINPLTGVAGAHGTFNIDASGVWTYTLDNTDPAVQALGAGQSLPNETFTVTSIDGTSQVVTVTITGTNDAPVAQAASAAVVEDAPLFSGTVTATDRDANAVLSFSLNAAPPPGLTFNPNGSYTFDASNPAYQSLAAGQQQVLTIPYTVTDDQGATSIANLVITVTGTNDAPVAVNDSASTPINTPLASIDVLGNDRELDGGTLSVTAASLVNPALGSLSINPNGTLAFTPASNVSGPVVVNYTVSDGQGGFSNAALTITVGTNTPPAGTDTTVVLAEDTSRTFSAADFGYSDADAGQSFAQVRIDTLPTAGTLSLNGVAVAAGQVVAVADLGNLLFTPAPNANGSAYADFDFSVQDSAGAFDTTPNRLSIAVSAVNDAPFASGTATLAAINEDSTNPPGASVGSLFADRFSDATDQVSGGSSANTLAGIAISSHTIDSSKGAWQFSTDGGTSWSALPARSTSSALTLVTSDLLRFLPAANYNGSATPLAAHLIESGGAPILSGAAVDLSGGTGGSTVYSAATVAVNETITPVNDAPVAVTDQFTTAEDVPLSIPLSTLTTNDIDLDGDPLQVYSIANPSGGTLSFDGTNIIFTPAPNYFGPASFEYAISDGKGGSSTAVVNIDISPVNDAPVNALPAGPLAAAEDTRLAIGGLSVADADETGGIAAQLLSTVQLSVTSGTLNVALVGGASLSAGANNSTTLTLSGTQADINATLASLSYLGNPNFNGSDALTVRSTDAGGLNDVDTVAISVAPVNDPPVAVTDRFSTAEDVPLSIPLSTLTTNDIDLDGDPLQVYSIANPSGGTLSFDGTNIIFTPTPNYFGPASFEYAISDGKGGSSTAVVNIDISSVNDAPLARNDEGNVTAAQTLTVTAAEGVIQSTSVSAGRDTDVDGDVLTVTRVSAGAGAPTTLVPAGGVSIAGNFGDLLLRSDGSYSYTASRADAVATGTQVNDVFTYQVSDGNGGFASALLTVRVGGAADTLTAAPPTTTALTSTLGLNGEYYGYNDFNPGPTSPNRRHADDGVYGNLDRAADVTSIVNGRNAAFTPPGTPGIVGSSTAAAADAADARFIARAIDYGASPAVTGTLGTNPNIAAGGSTAGLTNNNSQLFKFLNRSGDGDASSITVGRGTGDNDQIGGGPTSGLGRTSDAAIRLSGQAYLAAGLYDIRVYADDGFRLRLDDQTVAAFDNIQSPTTRVYTGVPIDGGLTPLELLYWEQGGNAVLRVEFKLSGTADSAYQVLGSQNLPLFSDANAPVLSDLQDLVAGPTPGSYLVRTGSLLDGGNGDDTLTGSAGRDILLGGQGTDTLTGGAGDDLIRGGAGHDQLTGGAGHDVFRWSLGDAGAAGTPARDVITDFDNTPHAGDVLDLRDLLVGESHAANTVALPASIGLNNALTITANEGNLANYLHFSAVGGNTVVEISSTGGFASSYTPTAVDQVITLTGLNLVGSFSNDQQVINDLLQRGKLVTD